MSLSLRLFVFKDPTELIEQKVVSPKKILSFIDDYQIFGQLMNLGREREDIPKNPTITTKPIPENLWIKNDKDKIIEDAYGEELTFVSAQQLKQLKMPKDAHQKNIEIKAFIDNLPDNTPIILYWH